MKDQSGPMDENRSHTPVIVTKGVVIYSDAARRTLNLPTFASVDTSPQEAIFHVGEAQCDIPSMVELPMWTRNTNLYQSVWGDSKMDQDLHHFRSERNTTAHGLFVNGNFDSPAFGKAPMPTGNIYVFRSDGIDLLPKHVEALLTFYSSILTKLSEIKEGLGLATDSIIRGKQREYFCKQATRRGFNFFFNEFCKRKRGDHHEWQNLLSPYQSLAFTTLAPIPNSYNAGVNVLHRAQHIARQISHSPFNSMETSRCRQSARGHEIKRRIGVAPDCGNAGERPIHNVRPMPGQNISPRPSGTVARMYRGPHQPLSLDRGKQRASHLANGLTNKNGKPLEKFPTSRKRKATTDSDDGGRGLRRRIAPVDAKAPPLIYQRTAADETNPYQNHGLYWNKATVAVGQDSPYRDIPSPTREERRRYSKVHENNWATVCDVSRGSRRRRPSLARMNESNTKSDKKQGIDEASIQEHRQEVQARHVAAARLIRQTELAVPDEQAFRQMLEGAIHDKNVVSEENTGNAQTIVEQESSATESLTKSPSQQAIPQEYSEKESAAATAASSKEGLLASHVLEPQRILSEEELEEQNRTEAEWEAVGFIAEQGFDEYTGSLELMSNSEHDTYLDLYLIGKNA